MCSHVSTFSGEDCKNSTKYAQGIMIYLLVGYLLVLCSAIKLFIKKRKTSASCCGCNFSPNAATTTLIRIIIALLAFIALHLMDLLALFLKIQDNSSSIIYCVLIIAAFTQEIGSALNISFLWLELSAPNVTNRINNLTWTKRTFFILQMVLLLSFGTVTLLLDITASLLLFCFFMLLVAVSFIIAANSVSKVHKISRRVLRSSGQKSGAERIVFTSYVISFDATVLSIAVCCVLASYINRSPKFGFFSTFVIKLFNLHLMVAIIQYLNGKTFSASYALIELLKPVIHTIMHRVRRRKAAKIVIVGPKRETIEFQLT